MPSSADAAAELLTRRRARQWLLDFTTYTFPSYIAEPAHALIAEYLDRVVRGDLKRLMVFAPPQHGKSELTSVRFPAYWLGRRPDEPVILASYGADLAVSKGRQARAIVESDQYMRLFPGVTTSRDSRAADHWELKAPQRGGMLAVGVGGPITGHGGRVGIVDDPVENWAQAQSPTMRDNVWEWYRTTFRTRVWEDGAIVLIMTRWHEEDLAGRLLQEQAKEWSVLRLPALAETQEERDANNRFLGLPTGESDPLERQPGEPLCPRRYSAETLEHLRRDVGSIAWAAEYQGVPRAPEGNRFRRSWFPIVDAAPEKVQRLRYWDLAASRDGCFTAGVCMAKAPDGIYYIEDVVRGQWTPQERDKVMLQTAQLDGHSVHVWVEQEPGSAGVSLIAALVRSLAGYVLKADKVTGSKDVRLEPFAAQAEAGNVRLVRGPWNGLFIEELCSVPLGRYRDQADATAGAFNQLATRRQFSMGFA